MVCGCEEDSWDNEGCCNCQEKYNYYTGSSAGLSTFEDELSPGVSLFLTRLLTFVSFAFLLQGILILVVGDTDKKWDASLSVSGRTTTPVRPVVFSGCIMIIAGVVHIIVSMFLHSQFNSDTENGRHNILWITESILKSPFFFAAGFMFGIRDIWLLLTFSILLGMASIFKLFAEYAENALVAIAGFVFNLYVFGITFSFRGEYGPEGIALEVIVPALFILEYAIFFFPVCRDDTGPPRLVVIIFSILVNLVSFSLIAWLFMACGKNK